MKLSFTGSPIGTSHKNLLFSYVNIFILFWKIEILIIQTPSGRKDRAFVEMKIVQDEIEFYRQSNWHKS